LRTPGVSRMTLKRSDQAISPTGLPSASLMLKPKSTSGFGVPSCSFTRKYAARFARTRSRTSFGAKPWRRKMRAATSTVSVDRVLHAHLERQRAGVDLGHLLEHQVLERGRRHAPASTAG
jgi:hypothetical protein